MFTNDQPFELLNAGLIVGGSIVIPNCAARSGCWTGLTPSRAPGARQKPRLAHSAARDSMRLMRVSNWRIGLFIAAATCIAFVPCLQNLFVYDDGLTNAGNFRPLDAAKLKWMFSTFYMGHYQPLTWLSLGLDYELWHENPRGYHLANMLLHAVNAGLVYALALRLIARGLRVQQRAGAGRSVAVQAGAILAALLFALHPLRVGSVAWVTDRPDLLSTLFLLLTVWAYVRARPDLSSGAPDLSANGPNRSRPEPSPKRQRRQTRPEGQRSRSAAAGLVLPTAAAELRASISATASERKWFLAAIGFYALALLSRSMGVMLPFALLVLDGFPLRRLTPAAGRSRLACLARLAGEKWPLFALAIAAAMVAPLAKTASHDMVSLAEHGVVGRLAQACYGLVFYPRKTVVPLGLLPIYELRPPLAVFTPRYLVPIVTVVLTGAVLWLLRRRVPALVAAVLCYTILIAPLLGVVQAGRQEVADRYSYWPGIAWALVAGGGAAWLWIRLQRRLPRIALGLASTATLLVLAVLTWRQCQVWRSDDSLWPYALAHGPPSAITYFNCAHVAELQNKPGEVLPYIEKAVELRPDWTLARKTCADWLAAIGRWQEAATAYRIVLDQEPGNAEATDGLAKVTARLGALQNPPSPPTGTPARSP